jgi:hypothetical protein
MFRMATAVTSYRLTIPTIGENVVQLGQSRRFEGEGSPNRDLYVRAGIDENDRTPYVALDCERVTSCTSEGRAEIDFRPKGRQGGDAVRVSAVPVYALAPVSIASFDEEPKRRKRKSIVPDAWPAEPAIAEPGKSVCSLCLEREAVCYFNNCRHATLCTRCAREHYKKFKGRCSICRTPFDRIKRFRPIFFS